MKLLDYIKFGFGFYIGHTVAKELDKVVAEVYKVMKNRMKEGY